MKNSNSTSIEALKSTFKALENARREARKNGNRDALNAAREALEAFKLENAAYETLAGFRRGELTPNYFAGESRTDASDKTGFAAYLAKKDAELFGIPSTSAHLKAFAFAKLAEELSKEEAEMNFRAPSAYMEALLRNASLAGLTAAGELYEADDVRETSYYERFENLAESLSNREELQEELEVEELLAESL